MADETASKLGGPQEASGIPIAKKGSSEIR